MRTEFSPGSHLLRVMLRAGPRRTMDAPYAGTNSRASPVGPGGDTPMRTSRMTSRPIVPARRNPSAGPSVTRRRVGERCVLAGLAMGLVLLLGGCGTGDGNVSSTRSSTERSGSRPAPSVTESPSETATPPTLPTRTSAGTPTSTRPPATTRTSTSIEPPTSAAALPPTSTSTPSAAGESASGESGGLGALGWILLAVLVAVLIAAVVIWRSHRNSAWDAEAAALEADTRTTTSTQLPPVLTAETVGQRALSWPPLRTGLLDLIGRWDLLAERASDDRRRTRSVQVRSLLQELVAAVDAENDALAAGRDWRLLRPRVDEAGRALSAVLAGVPRQEPPAGGEPGQPPPGQWQPPDGVE